jgi:hypothetical protein
MKLIYVAFVFNELTENDMPVVATDKSSQAAEALMAEWLEANNESGSYKSGWVSEVPFDSKEEDDA